MIPKAQPVLGGMFEVPDRVEMAPASLAGWERIVATLEQRQVAAMRVLYGYLDATGYTDATTAEMAEWSGRPILSLRPRFSELRRLGMIERGPIRRSRVFSEAPSHPLRPTVSRAAFERGRGK